MRTNVLLLGVLATVGCNLPLLSRDHDTSGGSGIPTEIVTEHGLAAGDAVVIGNVPSSGCGTAPSYGGGTSEASVSVGGATRTVRVHMPPG